MSETPQFDYIQNGFFGAGENDSGEWIVWFDAPLAVSFRNSIATGVPMHSVTVLRLDVHGEASACQIMLPPHADEDRHALVMKTLAFGIEDATPIARSRAMLWVGISAGPSRVPEAVLDILIRRNPRATRAQQLALTAAIWDGGLRTFAERLGKDRVSQYKSVAGWSCLYAAPQLATPDSYRTAGRGANAATGAMGVRTVGAAERGASRYRR